MWKILILLLLSSCSSITVTLKSISKEPPKNNRVFVEPQGSPFEPFVAKALKDAGFQPVDKAEPGVMLVHFSYFQEYENKPGVAVPSYERRITVTAFRDKEQVWETSVHSRGEISDPEVLVPTLLRAATPFLGVNSNGALNIEAPVVSNL